MSADAGLPRVAVLGHLCVDVKPTQVDFTHVTPGRLREAGELELTIGGAVANTGRVLASLGVACRGCGAVGDDLLGSYIKDQLGSWPRLVGEIETTAAIGTSYTLVIEPGGVDRAFWNYPGANRDFDGSGAVLDGLDLLHMGYPSLMPAFQRDGGALLIELFARARAFGISTSLDLAVVDRERPVGRLDWAAMLSAWGPLTDVISPSYDDLTSALGIDDPFSERLLAELGERLLGWGYAIVCLSAGANGFWLGAASQDRLTSGGRVVAALPPSWAGARVRLPAIMNQRPRTTIGAGDAATAGLLKALLDGSGPDHAVGQARRVASAVIAIGGAGEFTADRARTALSP